MKVIPLHDNVLIRPDKPENMTKGGIYIPDVAQKKTKMGTVLAAGPGCTLSDGEVVTVTLKEGDRALYGEWAGNEIEVDGEKLGLLIMRERDVLARIEDE